MVTGRASAHGAVGSLVAWFRREGADLPWRRTRDRYRVLVAEAQLQATPVARVVPYYERFIARWPTAADLAGAELGDVLAEWQGLGYPRRARNLHAAARVVAEHGWPERLTDLPGVGPYTAAAIRCFADGEDVLPLDTNAARVVARRFPGGWPGAPGAGWEAGQAVMDLGRLWCTARAPALRRGVPPSRGLPGRRGRDGRPRGARRAAGRAATRGRCASGAGCCCGALASLGWASVDSDPEAAESLVADGLAAAARRAAGARGVGRREGAAGGGGGDHRARRPRPGEPARARAWASPGAGSSRAASARRARTTARRWPASCARSSAIAVAGRGRACGRPPPGPSSCGSSAASGPAASGPGPSGASSSAGCGARTCPALTVPARPDTPASCAPSRGAGLSRRDLCDAGYTFRRTLGGGDGQGKAGAAQQHQDHGADSSALDALESLERAERSAAEAERTEPRGPRPPPDPVEAEKE